MLHGPNLDLLGAREPEHYGRMTLAQIDARLDELAAELGVSLEHFQSNWEGALIDRLHEAMGQVDGVLINPGGLTHSSVSLRDAFSATRLPFVEVHLSRVASREPFRQQNLFADLALGSVVGFGPTSYILGLRGLVSALSERSR